MKGQRMKHPLQLITLLVALLAGSSALAAPPSEPPRSGNNGSENKPTQKLVDLNQSTQAELATLPGIGPSKAQAIIRYREKVRPFRKTSDIIRVKGIGRSTFRRIRDLITVVASSRSPKK